MTTIMDGDLAVKLARRLQLSDSDTAAAAAAAGSDRESQSDTDSGLDSADQSISIDDLIRQKRQRQSRSQSLICPQLARKLALRRQRSETMEDETEIQVVGVADYQQQQMSEDCSEELTPLAEQSELGFEQKSEHQSEQQSEQQSEHQSENQSEQQSEQKSEQQSEQKSEQQSEQTPWGQRRRSSAANVSRSSSSSLASATAKPAANSDIESIGPDGEVSWKKIKRKFNPTTEFPDLSPRKVTRLKEAFVMYDADKDNFIGLEDLKLMMEKLGAPQTHLGLKAMIKEVDDDNNGKINFRGFLTIFKKARAGELDSASELLAWYDEYIDVKEIDVEEVGVMEAKNFFESKIALSAAGDKYKAQILEEQRRKQAEEEAKQKSRDNFRDKRSLFNAE